MGRSMWRKQRLVSNLLTEVRNRPVPVRGLLGPWLQNSEVRGASERNFNSIYSQFPSLTLLPSAPPPVRAVAGLESHRSADPVRRSCTPHALFYDLTPDVPRWS